MNSDCASISKVPVPSMLLTPKQLRKLHTSIKNAVRSVSATQNEFSPIGRLPPETLVNISEFVTAPRTRESVFEIVKMSHICQYWRSTLISYPQLWSSIFVRNDHKDFIAACLERSREVPLAVHLDLKHGDYEDYPRCTCIRDEWTSEMEINERNRCRYHTTIDPLLDVHATWRIRTLVVSLAMLGNTEEDSDEDPDSDPNEDFQGVLYKLKLFSFPLPILESLSFGVDHEHDFITHLELPEDLFCLESSPPPKLCHLALHGCYGGPIRAVRNLTSFKLATRDNIELDQFTFLPFISGNRFLVSLSLSGCSFPDPAELSQVTPVELPELKSLQLMDIYELPSFLGLVDVPAFKTLSSLQISVRIHHLRLDTLVHAEGDGGFQLLYNFPKYDEIASDWVDIVHGADPSPAVIRFEDSEHMLSMTNAMEVLPLPLFVKAKVLEIGASFARIGYPYFWGDLEKAGPQLTTLRLEVTRWMDPGVSMSVEEFVKARFNRGMPLRRLERMVFGGMKREREEGAKKLWEEFRAGLDIDQYLVPQ